MNPRRTLTLTPDILAVIALTLLWSIFFWRLFTPIRADQASLTRGDFSDQFVTFGAYQYSRFSAGEVPLWNPYNNGGLPFIADTQAAVFYPPRLITIGLSSLAGGWTYHALELEMTAHVLFYTLTFYALARRMTGHVLGAFLAAVVAGYGGYLTGYPPLQLALLEAGVWLPLAVLGIYETTHDTQFRWRWLILTGAALGLSWMAGHPQTSYFLTYLLLAYFGYRVYVRGWHWTRFIIGAALFGVIAVGAVAVTLLPGLEYLARASRSELGFDAKGGGFPLQDLLQFIFPGILTQWSPLYVGIIGLVLAVMGAYTRWNEEGGFWLGVMLFGLALSLGTNSALFHALYNFLPGLRYFRGQERAAFLVANSLAILVGYGATALFTGQFSERVVRLRQALAALFAAAIALGAPVFTEWVSYRDTLPPAIGPIVFSAIIAGIAVLLIPEIAKNARLRWLLVLLAIFELFSVNIDNSNYDPAPPDTQIRQNPLLEIPLADNALPFRVDGLRVLGGNYGSYYGLADIQGISPLFLSGPQTIIEYGLPDERAWELFSVRYVYSDWDALPVPGVVLAEGEDAQGAVKLHQLTAQRPYAHLVYDYMKADSDEDARLLLADPAFDPRTVAILNADPNLDLPDDPPEGTGTTITRYQPEALTVIVNTAENALLSLAHVDYPGWYATINGLDTPILRAYGGLMALAIPAGEHTVELVYNPLTYRAGAIISAITWLALLCFSVISVALWFRKNANKSTRSKLVRQS